MARHHFQLWIGYLGIGLCLIAALPLLVPGTLPSLVLSILTSAPPGPLTSLPEEEEGKDGEIGGATLTISAVRRDGRRGSRHDQHAHPLHPPSSEGFASTGHSIRTLIPSVRTTINGVGAYLRC